MTEENKQRIFYADILRIVAIIAVVILHTAAYLTYKFNSIELSWWWIGNTFNSATRWSVPIFIMLSGMLLLDPKKEDSVKIFYTKRFKKVLIPYIFWGIVYIIWTYKESIIENQPLPILRIIGSFFSGTVFFHLWFINLILGLYVLTPFIRIYIKNLDLNNLRWLLMVWFITNSIFSIIKIIFNTEMGTVVNFFLGYLGYYILGYYLHITNLNKKQINYIYLISIIGFLITIIGTFILTTNNNGILRGNLYQFLSPNVILMSIGIFIYFKNFNLNKLIDNQVFISDKISIHSIIEFSSLSFGIYLIHALILILLSQLPIKINAMFIHPMIGIPFTSILTLSISFYILKFLKRFSLSRYIM